MIYYKSIEVEPLSADGGEIEGYASTFDRIPDSYGDVVAKGAFSDWLARNDGRPIPFLFGHDVGDPYSNIGSARAVEDERGLRFVARFDAENPKAQYVRKLYREGRISQFSFAFDIDDQGTVEIDGARFRELRKLSVFEISAVPIPANPRAEALSVKAAGDDLADAVEALTRRVDEMREQADGMQARIERISDAIDGLAPDDGDDEGGEGKPEGREESEFSQEARSLYESITKEDR
ncbi:HK97 family phage prohead protease [Eggerthellaceae bacterium zg-997]|nr:HK97 family phage prohead protease [Eggerthellaceae bacterium zg-997]